MKPTLTSCESLWMLSFQPRQVSRATNMPPKHMYLHYVAHFVYLVCIILIMFSSTLNYWTRCTQIYQDTSPWGAGSSSHSAPAKIWTYTWSVCSRPLLTCLELSATCQLSVGGWLPLCNSTINAQARAISNPIQHDID
jgi:hypothetical protein